jgi:hypothetical protein
MISEKERFNVEHPDLCPALRWKGQFVASEGEAVPGDGLFWCLHSQTCIGPDGDVAEPRKCSFKARLCHGSGRCI